MRNISNFHHAAITIAGVAVRISGLAIQLVHVSLSCCRITYPSATNSHIENKIHWATGQCVPDSFIVDSSPGDLVILSSIHEPSNSLVPPTALGSVNLNPPVVPALVWDTNSVADSCSFITNTSGVHVAVDSSVSSQLSIDCLHDIELSTRRPAPASTKNVTKHPEGGPDACLVVDSASTETDLSFGAGNFACLGRENIFAFYASGSPTL